ncbi:MAG: oxygen-independent coproporphyrinogen III oxidase [Verrucomicrobia bacterium]|nr:oxygen-independent coproporphyrinogen III oxidase [Verrucomicrobiota bacterium]
MYETFDDTLLSRLNEPVPRYTSYPTAPVWESTTPEVYERHLSQIAKRSNPLSLYVHIPFCKTMCLFCGCSVILNRRPENEETYVNYLCKEIELVSAAIGGRAPICQLHFGGGTPTKLTQDQLERIFFKIVSAFPLDAHAEIAMEIDPRTVVEDEGAKLKLLKKLGFTRVSFGVQDTNAWVQEAIKRRQSLEVTQKTFRLAQSLEFQGINLDLIYGLPFQTVATFRETVHAILEMRPDRIALFSYAKIPWLKPHQKAIKEETLPSTHEKFGMYLAARKLLLGAGYVAIGMDHFALPGDELVEAFKAKTLRRNFQGYTVLPADDLIGLGITSIGSVGDGYFQNVKELSTYYQLLDEGKLATFRGKILSPDDLLRQWVIQRLMCDFAVDKAQFQLKFGTSFDGYFHQERERLKPLIDLGLVSVDPVSVRATALGILFIRNISACFDRYFHKKEGPRQFSKAI